MRRLTKGLLGLMIVSVVAFTAVSIWAVRHYDVSLSFLAGKVIERAGIENSQINSLLQPPPRYVNQALDGVVRRGHPRILLPELAAWDGASVPPTMVKRLALYESLGTRLKSYQACGRNHMMGHVVCWLTTGETAQARQAVAKMLAAKLPPPSLKNDGTGIWAWALAFDLLARFQDLDQRERQTIAAKLGDHLKAQLVLLDGESASLWHGRSSLAAQAWLLAVALDGQPGYDATLTRRAQGHFQQTIRALALTEAWPGGYNYWINNRALVIALAASAYVNGLDNSSIKSEVVDTMRRVGLWAVYATRPDDRIEALGDEGPRVDLKDETRRAIDVIAQLTGDSVFATYSSYLERLRGRESYYRAYRWSFMLFNDPSVRPLSGIAVGGLSGLEHYLPKAELFGPGAMNLLIARSGWGPDDTFISMRAGHTFSHHGHYDAGHFTLFKGAPLAINSSMYNGFFTPHRLYYAIRTIAKNSLLVIRPGDTIKPHSLIELNVNDGGQRLVLPTGSRVRDIDHWREHIGAGNHYEGGELREYQLQAGDFVYLKADLTGAYDNSRYDTQGGIGKVIAVNRELLYLFGEDRLLVRDKVLATEPGYTKKWLLHTVNKPQVKNSRVILGNHDAGVLESADDSIRIENGDGSLDVKRILPEAAALRLIGGEGYEYFVENEDSSTASTLNASGSNFAQGGEQKPWFDNGMWRLEIRPSLPREEDEFLVALSPGIALDRSGEVNRLELKAGTASAVATTDHIVIYTGGNRLREMSFLLPGQQRRLLLVGVVAGDLYNLVIDGESTQYQTHRSGALKIMLPLEAVQGSSVTLRQN